MNVTTITMPMPRSMVVSGRTIAELEAIIEPGLQTFMEVGSALKEISERRLYREQGFGTFEEYCEKRWKFARQTAYDYLKAADVADNVRSSVQSLPSFTQARELASLPPERQREVASRVDFTTTTVRELKETIKRVKQPEQIAEPKTTAKPTPIVNRSEVRHAGRSKKDFEKVIARVVKSYESRAYHTKVDAIKIIHSDTGIKVEIIECPR